MAATTTNVVCACFFAVDCHMIIVIHIYNEMWNFVFFFVSFQTYIQSGYNIGRHINCLFQICMEYVILFLCQAALSGVVVLLFKWKNTTWSSWLREQASQFWYLSIFYRKDISNIWQFSFFLRWCLLDQCLGTSIEEHFGYNWKSTCSFDRFYRYALFSLESFSFAYEVRCILV